MSDELLDRLIMWPATQGRGDGLDASYVSRLMTEAANRLAAQDARASRPDVERAARIIQDWRDGNAGEDDAADTARLVLAAFPPGDCCHRMREALQPFARVAANIDLRRQDDENPVEVRWPASKGLTSRLIIRDFVDALAALAAPENAGGGDA